MTTAKKIAYRPIDRSAVPEGIRWDVPPHNQGQIVEVAYSDGIRGSRELACRGDRYQRVTDRSDGSVSYYMLDTRAGR